MSQTTLYLGLDPTNFKTANRLIHCPIIQAVPRPFDAPEIAHVFADIPKYTHFIFTSQVAIQVFFDCLSYHGYCYEDLIGKTIIAIGKATAAAFAKRGSGIIQTAKEETQEGIIKMLAIQDLEDAYILLPCSSLARPDLAHFLVVRRIRHQLCHTYDTKFLKPTKQIDFDEIDEIVFTSPSTVDAFQEIFGKIPQDKKLTSIGPITENKLSLLFTN